MDYFGVALQIILTVSLTSSFWPESSSIAVYTGIIGLLSLFIWICYYYRLKEREERLEKEKTSMTNEMDVLKNKIESLNNKNTSLQLAVTSQQKTLASQQSTLESQQDKISILENSLLMLQIQLKNSASVVNTEVQGARPEQATDA